MPKPDPYGLYPDEALHDDLSGASWLVLGFVAALVVIGVAALAWWAF